MKKSGYFCQVHAQDAPLIQSMKIPLPMLDMELTERCNNRCIHCCINRPPDDPVARRDEMSTQRIHDLLREAVKLGCLMVRFTGGEPLLRKDFEEIYIFARNLGMVVLLFTNATKISEKLARRLGKIPPLFPVEVSFYGTSAETHDRVTREPGSFAAACQGVTLLLQHNVKCRIKGVLVAEGGNTQEAMAVWMQTRFPKTLHTVSQPVLELRTRRDSERKNNRIQNLRLVPETLSHHILASTNGRRSILHFCRNFSGQPGKRIFHCSAGQQQASVDAYGKLQPCLLMRSPDMVYDLRCGSIQDALTSFFPKMRHLQARNRFYLEHCAKCFLHGLCNQCPARAWSESGELDAPVPYYCEIAHAMARQLGLLTAREKGWEKIDWKHRLQNPAPVFFGAASTSNHNKRAEIIHTEENLDRKQPLPGSGF